MTKTLLTMIMAAAMPASAQGWDQISGQTSEIAEKKMVSVHNTKDWAALWAQHQKGSPKAMTVPAVDFSKEMVVAVFLGEMRTAGYKIELEVQQDPLTPTTLFVLYRVTKPSTRSFLSQVITRPYAILKVPKCYTKVVFEPNLEFRLPETFTKRPDNKINVDFPRFEALADALGQQ